MWGLAAALYAACKLFTLWPHRGTGTARGRAAYLLLWPGMDARAFLDPALRPAPPRAGEWCFAAAKTLLGAALIWLAVPRAADPVLKGWIGLVGMIFLLHFGAFHLASAAWRALGVQAVPIMRAPILSASLGEFWGRRWNLGFHDPARRFIFEPLSKRAGPGAAALAVFLVSGLVHDLVISVPAGGGYGLPTAYFAIQGLGVLLERRLRFTSRIFAILVAAGPVYGLFHPPFVRNVILPFLEVIT
jgi:hypothetical protein